MEERLGEHCGVVQNAFSNTVDSAEERPDGACRRMGRPTLGPASVLVGAKIENVGAL